MAKMIETVDKKKPVKVQVSMTEEMCVKLDEVRKLFDQSRSGMICYFIGQGLMGYKTVQDVIGELAERELRKEAGTQ